MQGIYHWLDGASMPTVDNLYALSELPSIHLRLRGEMEPHGLRILRTQLSFMVIPMKTSRPVS